MIKITFYIFIKQKENVKLGQRKGLSEKDVLKMNAMYENICGDESGLGQRPPPDPLQVIIKWIETTFGF